MSQINNPYHKQTYINLGDTCKIDGTSDDSVPFTAAYTLASTLGMGLFHPGGTLIKGNDTLLSSVPIAGIGIDAASIKLKNGANTDLFSANTSSINLSASYNTGSTTGVNKFGFSNLTLDGNKANQTSGTSYPLRFYGWQHYFSNVMVKNGYSGGILCDFNGYAGATDGFEPRWENVNIADCNGIGIEVGGPTDMRWANVIVGNVGSHAVHIGPNASALLASNCHFWLGSTQAANSVVVLDEAYKCQFVNCEAEGSGTAQLVLLCGQTVWNGGSIFHNPAANVYGVQLGQAAGGTPYAGSVFQSAGLTTAVTAYENLLVANIHDCQSGAINEVSVLGNVYYLTVEQSSGTAIASNSGYLNASSSGLISVVGLTADGSQGKGGVYQVGGVDSFNAFVFYNPSAQQVFNINTHGTSSVQVNSGVTLGFFSDNGGTQRASISATNGNIATNGQIAVGQSASAAAVASSGTITTSNVSEARIAPTGAVTGVILQAGTVAGQICKVVNESAFTVTFAASGTSHVADGTSAVISANRMMNFIWDSGTSLWYHS